MLPPQAAKFESRPIQPDPILNMFFIKIFCLKNQRESNFITAKLCSVLVNFWFFRKCL